MSDEKNKTEESSTASSKKRLLLIDDEDIILEILTAFLEDEYEIFAFELPELAIEKIKTDEFDIILTDFSMGTKTAIEVIEAASIHLSKIPIVVMTGDDKDGPDALKCLELGATEILGKPFRDSKEIFETLERCLQLTESKIAC